ncbi:helix-turn-helix transcriptional regulator [Actinosynnema sp. NPDC020468]|uniref:helix-turn-helix transcriptional regulator n=1 Tax=Actinosynnema sp. NPDC020468 TaxID=3154488 RepID=UPI0033CB125D
MAEGEQPDITGSARARLAHEIRRRRTEAGLSQPQLAKKIGYTRQYVSLAEREVHNLPSAEFIKAIDQALDAGGVLTALRAQGKAEQEHLRQRSNDRRARFDERPETVAPPRLSGRTPITPTGPGALSYAAALVDRLHRTYQAARYAEATQALPGTFDTVSSLIAETTGRSRRHALSLYCQTAVVSAKIATKAGDGIAAYEAADQARTAADEAEDVHGQASAAYQLTCALLRLHDAGGAEEHALTSADALPATDRADATWRGMLMLIAAVSAARRGDKPEARQRLRHAEHCATVLGHDANIGFTAFGPTNVAIHRVSVARSSDDPHHLLAEAEQVDIATLPDGLHGRRGRFHLDNAWAHTRLRQDPLAVIHLLEAERTAPQLLHTDPTGHALVHELLSRERHRRTPGLRGLATRIGAHT